jgi:hypothetical protein
MNEEPRPRNLYRQHEGYWCGSSDTGISGNSFDG